MATILPKSLDTNGTKKPHHTTANDDNNTAIKPTYNHTKEGLIATNVDPILACEALREQNNALRQELHDIRREMDEITDQFRTEDADEFKQLQAELEVAGKNCRILQFKLRKAEKRNENIENEKSVLEDKIQQIIRDNNRVRELDEELLVAKEVSVRLHTELEKSEESRIITEKLNLSLKQHLDTLKELLDQKLSKTTNDDYHSWQLSMHLYESLFREYILMEELTWLNTKHFNQTNGNELSDLINSYQQKISSLNDDISHLKDNLTDRDKEISQLRIQYKILTQRSQSVDRSSSAIDDNLNRLKRGISVDAGGNLREQLEASNDEIRLLKNKLLRLEDELNNTVLEKETLLVKLDDQSINGDLQTFAQQINTLIILIKENQTDEKIITDLQQTLRSSRWNKQPTTDQGESQSNISKTIDQTSEIIRQANELLTLFQTKQTLLEKIRLHLTNITFDAGDTCTLLEELDTIKKNFDDKQQLCNRLQKSIENLQLASKKSDEQLHKNQILFDQQKIVNNELQQENTRLSTLNAKQLQELKHLEQLRQSILTFEKKLDQKQTRVNELSMKIIEKEDLIETKVKECQKHRVELRELETKYYTLGKQLEEQIIGMTKEMEKLKVEKEMLRFDLESIRLTQQNERPISARSTAEEEIARVKSECRQQMIDNEIESYKIRLNQSNIERDELLKSIRDMEKKNKDLQMKSDVNEQSWARLKTDMSEKQRKYDESIKLKSELQNAVDRLRQKLHDLEIHSLDKQNKFTIEKHRWEIQRLELTGKINELEEQLSKVTKRQRKDLETNWKKERNDLQKQLQQSQQSMKDMQKQITNREAPSHLTEKINILITENELLLNKIKDLEHVGDDVQLLKGEMQRVREKNASDWSYWRKQQSDLYAQLRQQQFIKETILNKFDRLQKKIKYGDSDDRHLRDISIGPISLNSYQDEANVRRSPSNFSDQIELLDNEKNEVFKKTYLAQENTAASLEEITVKIDRVEDNLFSYRRFMDFIRAKSEKGSSVVRDDSLTNIAHQTSTSINNKRLASAPPENINQTFERRSRLDANVNNSHEHIPSSSNEKASADLLSDSLTSPITSSKNRFFSLSRRFRFRTQSPEKSTTVHFLDEDIDLETKEPTARKSDKPSKGILKTLRHRSPFRFRSKDAVIIEQETSAPPPPPPTPAQSAAPKEKKSKPPSQSANKQRGRLVELKKTPAKSSSSNGVPKKIVNVTPIIDPASASLVRRTSGLKDLIHKFEATPPKPKRISIDGSSPTEFNQEESFTFNLLNDDQSKTIDIPDLLQNVEKDPTMSTLSKPMLRHSNANRLTASFDSTASMVSASESITTTGSNTRKPTSTARPLMLSVNKEESS